MAHLEKQKTESGQASVEYILLIAIGVVLILGLSSVLYKPLGDWTKTYMTTYLECLLDVGELPSMGSSGDTPVCTLTPFKRGQAVNMSGAGGGLGNESIKGNGTSRNKNKSSASSNSNENGTANGRDGRVQGGLMGAETAANKKKMAGLDEAKGKEANSEENGGSTKYYRSRHQSFSSGAGPAADGPRANTFVERLTQPVSKAKTSSFTSRLSENTESEKLSSKKFTMPTNQRKIASPDADFQWGIAEYLKYAVIIAIILAIVIFLGGQILQIWKSMEKK